MFHVENLRPSIVNIVVNFDFSYIGSIQRLIDIVYAIGYNSVDVLTDQISQTFEDDPHSDQYEGMEIVKGVDQYHYLYPILGEHIGYLFYRDLCSIVDCKIISKQTSVIVVDLDILYGSGSDVTGTF